MADLDNKEKVIFSNGFTDSGHPVAMAAASATLDFIENNNLLDHVKKVAPYFQSTRLPRNLEAVAATKNRQVRFPEK